MNVKPVSNRMGHAMNKMNQTIKSVLLIGGVVAIMSGCSAAPDTKPPVTQPPATTQPQPQPGTQPQPQPKPQPEAPATKPGGSAGQTPNEPAQPTENHEAITVLVNKSVALPSGYRPSDLVEPQVSFIFDGYHEKRLMREEAARALERMFAGAKKDGIYLAGVSGYRSYETQESLFNYYVRTQGEETARKYSAEPGHSEHQTGLAMDISGSTGECAADDCFAGTPEANWLAAHAGEYGFIIRYPKGKEAITGYNYEPWHVRYIGTKIASEINAKGLTLEEYFGVAR